MRRRLWPPDPAQVADLLQTAKTALAGALAWWVAVSVLHLQQPFLAPWSAVLVVHSTLFRTLSRGGQQVAATFGGILLAWSLGQVFGAGVVTMGVLLLVAFLVGRLRWWREEATTIATTGIVVIATNAVAHSNLLTSRLVDSTVGILIGLAVNLVVWPPLRDRAAWTKLDRLPDELADVLAEMSPALRPDLKAEETQDWTTALRRIDMQVDEAWVVVRQARESSRFNPRRSSPAGLEEMDDALHLIEQAVADMLSMIRTIAASAENAVVWESEFRTEWARLLTATADGVRHHDEGELGHVLEELATLVTRLSTEALVQVAWDEYGGLLVNLRNIVESMVDVAAANPVTPADHHLP